MGREEQEDKRSTRNKNPGVGGPPRHTIRLCRFYRKSDHGKKKALRSMKNVKQS